MCHTISKGLTKIPEHYADKSSQPHVTVALRMKAKGQSVQVGETIPYVICQPDSTLADEEESRREKESFAARAHHPDDLRKHDSKLVIGENIWGVFRHPECSKIL